MKFSNRSQLVQVLDLVRPSVSTKDFDSILKCFHFSKDGIEGYNGDTYIKAFYPTELNFLVTANVFYKLVSDIPESVEFDIFAEKSTIKVKVGSKIEAKFPLVADYTFPCAPQNIKDISYPISEEVLEGLRTSLGFIGKDETKPVYRGVYINSEGIFATDGYRISNYKVGFSGELFLPEAFCSLLLKHKPREFKESDTAFMFQTPEVLVVSNKLTFTEPLPNYSGVIESAINSSNGRFIPISTDIINTCKRVFIFAEGLLDKYCELCFNKKAVTITVKNSNIGEITEKFEIPNSKYDNETVTVDLLLFQTILESSKEFELIPVSEDKPYPVIRGRNNNLEIIQITLS